MTNPVLATAVALVWAIGIGSIPASAAPFEANVGSLNLSQPVGSGLEQVHWRRYRHCHWWDGYRRCHGRYHHRRYYHDPYYDYPYWRRRPGIYFWFGPGRRHYGDWD